MLRSVVICPDRDLGHRLERTLLEIGGVDVIRTADRYLTSTEITRFMRAQAPQIVFLSVESVGHAIASTQTIEACSPGVQIIAVHRVFDPQILLEIMRVGIREFIAFPLERATVTESLARVRELLEKKPPHIEATDLLYSFLPAKAGVGTSTIAMNTAVALSKFEDTSTFLADFDLNSGMVRFMLKLDNSYSVIDAAERASDIDENFWPQLVTSIGSLDVLHAGKLNPNFRVEPLAMKRLLEFARRNYNVICADLSGNLEKYSIEIMHESKRVFLVCTPEIPSLHLAREKYQYLQKLDLGDRVTVLLNRCQKRPLITATQIEELLGLPVQMTFPNDYQGVHRALADGRPLDSSSELARQCLALANSMIDRKIPVSVEGSTSKKRFIEFFSISPGRSGMEGKKTSA